MTLINAESPYIAYAYSYPHKTAYRQLEPRVSLSEAWSTERRDALFLYLHIPFCEMRCGFCNLFTTTNPQVSLEAAYLKALRRQAEEVRSALGDCNVVRLAIGGGTPTYLDVEGLSFLFASVEDVFGVNLQTVPTFIEVSPATIDAEKLRLLKQNGVDRVSMGVQSFVESEVAAVGRSQSNKVVEHALELIQEAKFPTLNIDLIYGLPDQTQSTWISSINAALRYNPEEIFLYPLYVRPLTSLGRMKNEWDDNRLELYRTGRDLLLSHGYKQSSMRMFQGPHAPSSDGPAYCCQTDGMIGIGCGARSYTSSLHYSSRYAVSTPAVREIIDEYISTPAGSFAYADYGFKLGLREQRERFCLQSLLQADGLDLELYRENFGSTVFEDLPQLNGLISGRLAFVEGHHLLLTPSGMELSDAIAVDIYSVDVRERMANYVLQ